MAKVLRLLGTMMILSLPCAVRAQTTPGELADLLTIVGQVAADQKGAQQVAYDTVSISFSKEAADKVVWIGVVSARSWDQDSFRGKEILDQLEPYNPSMMATGKPAVMAKLQQAPVGSRVVVEGILDGSARLYVLGSVKVTPPGAK